VERKMYNQQVNPDNRAGFFIFAFSATKAT
jgi:hypothetical protein